MERIHMTAPDGRTFTFGQWCDYLKAHPDSVNEAYVAEDGKVFEIDGFRFNVNGHCVNPHMIMVGDHETGLELRTYRKWICVLDRRAVWWFDIYGYGMTGASGLGWVYGSEGDAILEGLRKAIRGMRDRARWYENQIRIERKVWGDERHMGYEAALARVRRGLAQAREEYDRRCQPTLF